MILATSDLPDDAELLKAMVLSMAGEVAQLRTINEDAEARIARLHAILKALERARFGRRSERLSDDQIDLVFEEAETGLSAIEAELDRAAPKRERAPRQRKAFPAHLERVEVVVEPEIAAFACGACERVKIGEDVSERLDVVPARFRVIVTRRPKYACKACREGIVQAEAPPRLIEGGVPTEALLAQVAVSKYADALPGVVGDARVRTVLAALHVPSKRRSAAALDRRHDLQLAEAYVAGIGSAPCRSLAAEDIRDLQRRTHAPGELCGWRVPPGT